MKRFAIALIALFLVVLIGQTQAQQVNQETKKEVKKEKKAERVALRKLNGEVVSEISKASFYKDFGNIQNVTWVRSDFYDEATFRKDGRDLTAFYDDNGDLVGTTCIMAFNEIPALVQKNILKTYKNAKPGKVIFYDDNEPNNTDMMLYGIQFDNPDSYFVELTQKNKTFIITCDLQGNVEFFKQL